MGQKSNLISLINPTGSLNLINLNSKIFLKNFLFIKSLEIFLIKKHIVLLDSKFIFFNNTCFIHLFVFFRSKKLSLFKKKKVLTSNENLVKLTYKTSYLNSLLKGINKQNKNAFAYFSIYNLNYKINKKLLTFFYFYLRKYTRFYFQRTFNLLIDFIKVCCLFCTNKITATSFLLFISLIFKSISKKAHTRFVYFLKHLFNSIIEKASSFAKTDYPSIKGFKFVISGRLRDKQRASFICIQEGTLSISSLRPGLQFCKRHVNTIYGVYGLKLWVFKQEPNI